jgi:DNA replication and repair protein RecF
MKLTSLKLINFRNYDLVDLEFPSMINIFYGKNAQGKTNLLEGIYYGAFGMSHRTSKEDELLRFQTEGLSVALRFTKSDEAHSLQIKRYIENEKIKKLLLLDEKKVSAREHYGFLNVILFSPEDLEIIKGEPALRRRFLDMGLAQTDRVYYDMLVQYNKSIRQRNKLLKNIRETGAPESLLDTWDKNISQLAAKILQKRLANLKDFNIICHRIGKALTGSREELNIIYNLKANNGVFLKITAEENKNWQEFYEKELLERRRIDILLGNTGIGIHRDDLTFLINGYDGKAFGSQGQKRSYALTLKLAQLEYIKEEIGEYPLLLLDDVMSELDEERRRLLLQFINAKVQTFITVNDRSLIPSLPDTVYYDVQEGVVSKV